jgi:DHA2 family multidrug resistance protein
MSHYTLETGASGIIGALIVQGVGFSFLFVPLTTVALSKIQRHKLADATGLNSLVRQIGGSFGLAIFATLLPRYTAQARAGLMANITPGRPELLMRLDAIRRSLMGHGYDPATATDAARRVIGGIVMQQSTVITFERCFLLSGVLFLIVLPLLLFLKSGRNEKQTKAEPVHVEI